MYANTSATVVLDWDGTLVSTVRSCKFEIESNVSVHIPDYMGSSGPPDAYIDIDQNGRHGNIGIYKRPYVEELLEVLKLDYELIIWSFGVVEYINKSINALGWDGKFAHTIARTSTEYLPLVKDLTRVNGSLDRIVMVDDSAASIGALNPDNCVGIGTWDVMAPGDDFALRDIPEQVESTFEFIAGRNDELITDHNNRAIELNIKIDAKRRTNQDA